MADAAPRKKKPKPAEENLKVEASEAVCTGPILDITRMPLQNPYDIKGKCFRIDYPLIKQHMMARTTALVGFIGPQDNYLALMDFGEESVPMGPITGTVMGVGAFRYETIAGSVNTIYHLKKIKDPSSSNSP